MRWHTTALSLPTAQARRGADRRLIQPSAYTQARSHLVCRWRIEELAVHILTGLAIEVAVGVVRVTPVSFPDSRRSRRSEVIVP